MSIGMESIDKGPFCQPCQRHFLHWQALRMHREMSKEHRGVARKNTNSKYQCNLCTKTFKSQDALNDHIRDSTSHRKSSPASNTIQANGPGPSAAAIQRTYRTKAKTATTNNHPKRHDTLLSGCGPLREVWGNWSAIPCAEHDSLVDTLREKCHSAQSLSKQGFWTQVPSKQDLNMRMKCKNCGGKRVPLTLLLIHSVVLTNIY